MWSGNTVKVSFTFDSWSYGRVEAVVGGVVVASKVLPDFDSGPTSVSFPAPANTKAVELSVQVTTCDDEDPTDPDTVCSTSTAYSGSVINADTGVKKGQVSAVTLLNSLSVKKPSHAGTYQRSKFGKGWVDANGDHEDTRVEVLKAESRKKVTIINGTAKAGRWVSPYDGKTITVGSKLDIDHVVPLAEAWQSGAASWSANKRLAYANDLGYGYSLVAVSKHANRSKGDKDPASWLPSKASFRCTYVKQYVSVKARWKLSVDATEKSAINTVLATCSSLGVKKASAPVISRLIPKPKPSRPVSGGSGSGSGGGSTHGLDPRYGTCTELLRHPNHAPYIRGVDPEYAWYMDRDGDGRVCE